MRRAVLLVTLLTCCFDDAGTALRLTITTSAPVLVNIDRVHVAITASSPEGRVCETANGLIELGSQGDLPVIVMVKQGSIYTETVAWEVYGSLDLIAVSEPQVGWSTWPDEGVQDVSLSLDQCFNVDPPCDEGEHCVMGGCSPIELPITFLDPHEVDEGTYCWGGG